ncbi:MAG: hypothetical protein U5N27_14210 [Rhizobium sp.]|nr:hypothetical protein [Rhizobium sp.]
MSEIRGEKLRFRKRDIVPLHALPSAQAEDPLIVHCPPPKRSLFRRLSRVLAGFAGLWVVVIFAVYAVVESGTLDAALAQRAQAVLNNALGPQFTAKIGGTEVRFSTGMELSVEARDVTVHEQAGGERVALTNSVRFILEPLALLGGRFSIREIVSEGINLDATVLPKGKPVDLSGWRIDHIPDRLADAFAELDRLQGFITRGGLDRMRLAGLEIASTSASGRPMTLAIDDIVLERGDDGSLSIFGAVAVNGQQTELTALTTNVDGRAESLTMRVADVRVTPFLLRRSSTGEARQGIDGSAELLLNARREAPGQDASVSLGINMQKAGFYSDGQRQEITDARLKLSYDFAKDTIELADSTARFDQTIFPLSGGLIDLDRLPEGSSFGKGFGIDLVVTDGRANVPRAGEAPFPFFLKGYGRYLVEENRLQLDTLDVSTPVGQHARQASGGLRWNGAGDPVQRRGREHAHHRGEAVVALLDCLQAARMGSRKPLWRPDPQGNGRRLHSAEPPVDRPEAGAARCRRTEDRFRSGRCTRLNLTGELPPLRDVYGRFDMVGERVDVAIRSAGSFFPSGRMVKLESGRLVLQDAYEKPLMADIDLDIAGAADAVAELVSFKPIEALKVVDFQPSDFSGKVRGQAKIRLGLVPDQSPPEPSWTAEVALNDVDVAKPFDGRQIADVTGSLSVDRDKAMLDASAKIDDVPMEVKLTEPVRRGEGAVAREQVVTATLDNAAREKLAPGLGEIVNGAIKLELRRLDETTQAVSVDLRSATLTIPWVGWSKGQGIGATAKFELAKDGKLSLIRKFALDGEGFGASGDMTADDTGLVAANLSRVRLSPEDEVALTVRLSKGVYSVVANGRAFDARSLISTLQRPSGDSGDTKASRTSLKIEGRFDRVVGFSGEQLSGVSIIYGASKGQISAVDFSGVTGSGQALVAKLRQPEGLRELSVTTSDAGAVLRFLDTYKRLGGGLANLRLTETRDGAWSGNLDLRNFQVENEERLQTIVSAPTGADGRSLNNAVRSDIDVRSARFQRAFARLALVGGTLSVENGIVRGEQVGATFQGIVRDQAGRIDLTGTFMPAYGLNRLFAELPVIGAILGNGRDRGLLGITFKLTGPTMKPNLVINPLSIIAPGVFRQIFEFR